MTIRKMLLTATVATTMFALTVPATFACDKCHDNSCTGAACPLERVTPDCGCHKKEKPSCGCKKKEKKEKCGCKKVEAPKCSSCDGPNSGAATGAAADMSCATKHNRQSYAYPNAVYSQADAATLGEKENNAVFGCDIAPVATGVNVESFDCMTGAAMPILDETCGFAAPLPCDCGIKVESATSIQMMKKSYVPKSIETPGITGAAAGMTDDFYPDVHDDFWAAPEINRLTCKDVAVGFPDGLFKPNRNVTRAELATLAVKGYKLNNTQLASEGDFRDVPRSHWAYDTINRAAVSNLMDAKSNGLFKPNSSMTRAEVMSVIAKGLNCPMECAKAEEILAKYSDGSSVPEWARIDVAKAIDNGALKSEDGRMIKPNKDASRAETAYMLQELRLAGGYDNTTKTASGAACDNVITKAMVEQETVLTIPTLELTFKDMINSKNANVGDQFAAATVNDITIDGMTFAAGSRVNGKVMEVIRPNGNCNGAIKLSFNTIEDCDGKKHNLPKQVLSARVACAKNANPVARLAKLPFTWTGAVIGDVGRTAGGMIVGAANAVESVLDNTGTGTGELVTGQFRASGRSYQDAGKNLIQAPVDFTRTALSGTMGAFQTTGDELSYLVDPSGKKISQINPKQKVTIAFGQ